jgi:hypothetical protein
MALRAFMLAMFLGAAAQAAAPVNGIDEPPRRGTFVETSLGVFTAMGGSRALSNAQPYLGMTFGREVGAAASIFASLGIGAASASCYQLEAQTGNCLAADSFGATFVEGGAAYGFPLGLRSLLSLKAVAGFTDLSPGPVLNGSTVPDHLGGFHFGAGAALDYHTHLDHFAVGFDALFRYSLARYTAAGGNSQTFRLPSLAVMPRIRYVF